MLSWELKAGSSFIILNSLFSKSSGRSSTTIPELLHRDPRLLGLIPLATICWGPLAAGTTKPPGHMQKLYTPLPSTWVTKLYSAAGRYLPRPLRLWYCIRSIREAGCSRRTPTAMPLASISTPLAASQRYTSRAECPVASITGPRNVRPVSVSMPFTSSFSIIRASIRVSKCTSPPQPIMVFRMFSMTRGSLSVPIWGCLRVWKMKRRAGRIRSGFCLRFPVFYCGYRACRPNRRLHRLLRNCNWIPG